MYKKIITLFAALLFAPQCLWAAVHTVSHNVATTVELHEDDEINLVNSPSDWTGYSRVVIGVRNLNGAQQLSGRLVTNDCDHSLRKFYEELDFVYTGDDKIVYHGPTQQVKIHWWGDVNPVVSLCNSYSEILRRDSITAMLYDFADSVYSDRIKDYKDLGALNSETYFEGTSANFKIVNLPDWFYNRIIVQVQPMDGRELDGHAYGGGGDSEIKGYSAQFAFSQTSLLAPTFELAFSEYRKVKLTWWAEVQAAEEIPVESIEKALTSDSIEVEYTFDEGIFGNGSVKLVFDKRKFVDGKVPVVKRLSFDPQGPNKSKELDVRGPIYDFDAKLNSGDSVVIAIPLDNDYRFDEDSITIEHFIEEENRWVEEPVDSIVGNFAYIKVGHFSWFRKLCRKVAKAIVYSNPIAAGCAIISESCHKAIDGAINKGVDAFANTIATVGRGLKKIYQLAKKLVCLDFGGHKQVYGISRSSDWDPIQGSIDKNVLTEHGQDVVSMMESKRTGNVLVKLSDPYPASCNDKLEECKWLRTKDNLDILLADAVMSQFSPDASYPSFGVPVYKFVANEGNAVLTDTRGLIYNFDEYFMVTSGLIEDAAWFVNGVKECYSTINLTGKIASNYADLMRGIKQGSYTQTCKAILGFAEKPFEWVKNGATCLDLVLSDRSILSGHEGKLIAVSEAMVRISLLAWLKKADGFRDFSLTRYKVTYDGIRAWLELAGPLLDYNNITTKAYGSLALYEYLNYGNAENLAMVNGGLNRHYGFNGGYSEGTGYSQYIWDDLTYVLAALKDAYKGQHENLVINGKFLNSPDYMFEFSRPVGLNGKSYGLIPVEIDDGVTYNPDYRVWAKLKGDPKYLAMSEKYPLKVEDGKINSLAAFGFPDISMYAPSAQKVVPYRGTLWGNFKDGIGMITAVNGNDTVALSMIAENGSLMSRGQAHDQQDNLSITLTSSVKGFLIQDPGYSGFGARSTSDHFHRYVDHNVVTDSYGQSDNRPISSSELLSRATDLTGDLPGLGPHLIGGILDIYTNLFSIGYEYTVDGGYSAYVLNRMIDEPQSGIVGYTAATMVGNTLFPVADNRTIMHFGGNLWVIDRLSASGLKWHINSPLNTWADINIHLNVSSQKDEITAQANPQDIAQNTGRADFEGQVLKNFTYEPYEANAHSYVMNYALGNNTFEKIDSNCPQDYQCFVNADGNMRVVVPPYGGKFKLCDILTSNECSGDVHSTGITMLAKTPLGEWTTRWVLDGDLSAVVNGAEVPIVSATVTRTAYSYMLANGAIVSGKYKGTYLPAVPILLLR